MKSETREARDKHQNTGKTARQLRAACRCVSAAACRRVAEPVWCESRASRRHAALVCVSRCGACLDAWPRESLLASLIQASTSIRCPLFTPNSTLPTISASKSTCASRSRGSIHSTRQHPDSASPTPCSIARHRQHPDSASLDTANTLILRRSSPPTPVPTDSAPAASLDTGCGGVTHSGVRRARRRGHAR